MANHLVASTSPYLLQHAHNPVEWYPWGAEAIERARREDKPLFLSIGYAACHWCHVMERESFENTQIAAVMNEHFVCIKVDREERPDLDDVYMLATQVMTGSGGWPMSVWLTHELKPFYAGTYFPPGDGHGRPGFGRLLLALAEAWRERRAALISQAEKVVEAVSHYADEAGRGNEESRMTHDKVGMPVAEWVGRAVERQADRFDEANGGMGSAPKFPPSQALLLWVTLLRAEGTGLRTAQTRGTLPDSALDLVRSMLTTTLDGMLRGGIYDQIGGAFARYSVDQYWLVPHFEKMLYDNAQLAPAYALAGDLLGREDFKRVARETLDFWLREMTSSDGAFYSTLDADSEGHEGKFYVWTPKEVRDALGNEADAELALQHFGVTEGGNFEGKNILTLARTVEELARQMAVGEKELRARVEGIKVKMRAARAKRVSPGLDDKVLTAWNGMMISALAICGRVLHEPRYLEAAHKAMGFLLLKHMEGGRKLFRASREVDGKRVAHIPAFLEDYAMLLNGMMDLVDATVPTSLPGTMARKRALELADVMIGKFADQERGGFFFTGETHEKLFVKMKNATDGATPSANGVAIRALLRLAASSGKVEYRDVAMKAIGAFAGVMAKSPSSFATILQGLLENQRLWEERTFGEAKGRALEVGIEPKMQAAGTGLELGIGKIEPVRAGETVQVELHLAIPKGFHIQVAKPAEQAVIATVVKVRGEVVEKQEWSYPEGQVVEGQMGYAGTVRFVGRVGILAGAKAGVHVMRASVLAQRCSGAACFAPETVTAEAELVVV